MINKIKASFGAIGTAAILIMTSAIPSAQAANINPDVIFGTGGNANGSFTVGTSNNIEIGLRAKQRFPPANIFNYDGAETYTFSAGESASGSGRPLWNFEWAVNTDLSGTSGVKLADLTFNLKLDLDKFSPKGVFP